MKKKSVIAAMLICLLVAACAPAPKVMHPVIPSLEYSRRINEQIAPRAQLNRGYQAPAAHHVAAPAYYGRRHDLRNARHPRGASIHNIKDYPSKDPKFAQDSYAKNDIITNEPYDDKEYQDYEVHRSRQLNSRDYNGPLSLGDPGVTASLWHESRSGNSLFRDHRAFQPMDLITILVSEDAEGKKEADTETKQESEVLLAIASLFNLENDIESSHSGLDTSQLVSADTTNDFKGEGQTTRKGSLTAKISAMVAEVLPSGILRVEGEKILVVNEEEQIMIISGLVRPKDINSANEVHSSKVASLRVDYFGKGIVGEAQYGGWFGRLLNVIWPF